MLTAPRPLGRRALLTYGAAAVGLVGLTLTGASACSAPSASVPTATPGVGRIVTLDPFSTYSLFDLGLEPVGVQDGLEEVINPSYAERYASLPTVGTYAEPDLETIVGLQPSLILASTGQAELEPKLAQITRTVLVTGATSSTWRQAAAEVAAAVDRDEQLTTLESSYLERAELTERAHADVLADTTFAMIWRGTAEGFSIRPPGSNGGQVLGLCGARWSEIMTSNADDSDTVLSWEQADRIADADVICVPGTTAGRPQPMTEVILAHPAFRALPAVRAGRVVVLDNMTPGSYVSATQLIEEFAAFLAEVG